MKTFICPECGLPQHLIVVNEEDGSEIWGCDGRHYIEY